MTGFRQLAAEGGDFSFEAHSAVSLSGTTDLTDGALPIVVIPEAAEPLSGIVRGAGVCGDPGSPLRDVRDDNESVRVVREVRG
jgi:hypothetical protein